MSQRTWAVIDVPALHHNFEQVKKLAPNSAILAMVKSNAYGHGIVSIGNILKQANGFGVACLHEAIMLREGGVATPIVLMSGVISEKDLTYVVKYNLDLVIHDLFQIKFLQSPLIQKPINVWLKIDTGMHRLGFAPEKVPEVYTSLANNSVVNNIQIMTHLADADDLQKDTTIEQIECFHRAVNNLNNPISIANSAGILAWPQSSGDWVRPGIMLYGVSPIGGKCGYDFNLRPVMTLKSKLISIHDFKQGDAIGYGGAWTCPEDMRVGVVAIGYGDGYPRHAKNGTPTLIRSKICTVVGHVSMDMISVDLRLCPKAAIGDDVILWGNGLPAEFVAKYADTIAYELMCNVSQRVEFEYQF